MRQKRTLPHNTVRESVILFTVAGFRFAMAASAVSEIRSAQGLDLFYGGNRHKATAKVAYTLERNGVTHFVVSVGRHFHLPSSTSTRVLILRHTAVALLVDNTDRMIEISVLHALPRAFAGDERTWYRGLAIVNGDAIPVVNPAAFLSRGEVAVLRAMTPPMQRAVAG